VKLRLSSAERLAKHPQLACIFVLIVSQSLQFEAIYCIHVIDDILSEILKSLRKCQATDATQVNKTRIGVDYVAVGTKIDVSGESLKRYMKSVAGESREDYGRRKAEQIANLGFIGHRYAGRFTLVAEDEREVADVMLGLKKGKVKEFSTTETRWGITLPHHHADAAEIMITPKPREGEITLRSEATGEAINLTMEIVTPPFPPTTEAGFAKARMFNEFIEFIIERENSTFSFSAEGTNQSPLSLRQHISLNKTLRILHGGKGTMGIRRGRRRTILAEFENEPSREDAEQFEFAQDILEGISVIVNSAGGGEIQLTVEEINAQIGAIKFVRDLITTPEEISVTSLKIKPTREFPPDLFETEALLIGRLVFHSAAIAFCAMCALKISGDADLKEVEVTQLKPREIDFIGLEQSSLEDFQKDMQAETGLGLMLQLGARGIRTETAADQTHGMDTQPGASQSVQR